MLYACAASRYAVFHSYFTSVCRRFGSHARKRAGWMKGEGKSETPHGRTARGKKKK
jgi:hypothetical protein